MKIKAEIYSTSKAEDVQKIRAILDDHGIKTYVLAYPVTDPRLYHRIRHATITSRYDYKICVAILNYRRAKKLIKRNNICYTVDG
jgi:hypothetical protein